MLSPSLDFKEYFSGVDEPRIDRHEAARPDGHTVHLRRRHDCRVRRTERIESRADESIVVSGPMIRGQTLVCGGSERNATGSHNSGLAAS